MARLLDMSLLDELQREAFFERIGRKKIAHRRGAEGAE